ncbi:MAG: zinc carboxypeptidase [Chitinophagaceae bacterium]|nr:MAG: zinc carboxypeptidase [Chitinophagaceae bacterium]
MRKFLVACALVITGFAGSAQLQSPEEFLGYKLGARYTPHSNIVAYFRHVAANLPNQIKLEQYGLTNERRPLMLAFIASAENFPKLESIRQNNLRLAGQGEDKQPGDENAPAIVWLSYNVHGNETNSSESSMMMLYELANPKNPKVKDWLKNTVIVIDPCINPDGRDRYVNWFNTMVGKVPNPRPYTREHNEPWPGGRSNHYNFDLNRDWAWQAQVESQQRLVKYNQWLPQIHVDYHEQGIESPYYFAPGAEPYHEVITGWQREFQTTIGKNNAKYFDQNGWLFFTKERFDLFYPSYGDTYPIYKGAIGMTYEQAGGGRAGAAVLNADGDTLSLYDRLLHHFTTGISTIEISSINSAKLVHEFRTFYDKAKTAPVGEFKSYVIKADEGDNLTRLKTLLDKNKIEWSYTNAANLSGLNYYTGKAEAFKAEAADIVVNANQPNSNLIKVLFERTSKLNDSVTYDITAWSMPLAYGLKAYGLASYVNGVNKTEKTKPATITGEGDAAYLVKWNGLSSAKYLAALLNKKVKVRFSEKEFTTNGLEYKKGTLIVTKTSNQAHGTNLRSLVEQAATATGVEVKAINSTFVDKGYDFGSGNVHSIKAPRIALLTGEGVSSLGAGELWHFFEQQLDYQVDLINATDLGRINLREFDVVIMPDGNYRFLNDKTQNEQLKAWVSGGGRIVAIEGAVVNLAKADWGMKLRTEEEDKKGDKKEDKKEDYSNLRKYENRERDQLVNYTPGAIYKVDLDNSHPLAFGYPDFYYTLKQDNNLYEFSKDNGWNVGVIKKDAQVAGFVGTKLKSRLKDGTVFGVIDIGRGSVTYLSDNPMFRSFWENGKLLFCNAVFFSGQ